ncbi:MAG: alpha/beta hydrolase [Pseudomonadota bacterium]
MKTVLSVVVASMATIFSVTAGAKTYTDIPYTAQAAPTDLQRLNLVVPDAQATATPLLVWIGGGAWAYVDRDKEMDMAERLSSAGIAVASVGHRLSPAVWRDPALDTGVQHPAHVEDVASAVAWLRDNAQTYGIDVDRIFIGGFSSGAHLATLVASDATYLKGVGLTTDAIAGVVAIGGTYDIPDYHRAFATGSRPELAVEHVEAVFGSDPASMAAASPAAHIETFDRPLLLVSDRNTYGYTRLYEDALVENERAAVTVVHARNLGHGPLWLHLSNDDDSFLRDMIATFVLSGMPAE